MGIELHPTILSLIERGRYRRSMSQLVLLGAVIAHYAETLCLCGYFPSPVPLSQESGHLTPAKKNTFAGVSDHVRLTNGSNGLNSSNALKGTNCLKPFAGATLTEPRNASGKAATRLP
jgi:hypothetical protein